jgi:hypothetical protein
MNANPFGGGRHPQSQTPGDQEPNHRNSGAVTLTLTDTLSLDTAVQFALARGASVRLIGDDQQLGAIGAGGVLRDITHTHGALRLTELHRFTNPPKRPHPSPSEKENPRHSTSTLITAAFMSATSPPPRRMPSRLGFPIERLGSMRS